MHTIPLEYQNSPGIASHDAEILKYIRELRHDFINHVQVIWGYLQLNKSEQAREYISGMIEELQVMGSIFKINNPSFSLSLYNNVRKAYKSGIAVDFEADVDSLNKFCIENDDIDGLLHIMDTCFEKLLKSSNANGRKNIYIDLYIEDYILYIILSNNADDSCMDMKYKNTGFDNGRVQKINTYHKSENGSFSIMIEVKPKRA